MAEIAQSMKEEIGAKKMLDIDNNNNKEKQELNCVNAFSIHTMKMPSIRKCIFTYRWGPYSTISVGLITFRNQLFAANEGHSVGEFQISKQHAGEAVPYGWHGPAQG
ncbi:hypothetical protein AMECASPLE_026019 [Ameca splendens]|uniref:Uncharacterized protein n=1 Tax=Ameca splendens TaxID=208324 RepID=A0ABV0YRT0_9TELE